MFLLTLQSFIEESDSLPDVHSLNGIIQDDDAEDHSDNVDGDQDASNKSPEVFFNFERAFGQGKDASGAIISIVKRGDQNDDNDYAFKSSAINSLVAGLLTRIHKIREGSSQKVPSVLFFKDVSLFYPHHRTFFHQLSLRLARYSNILPICAITPNPSRSSASESEQWIKAVQLFPHTVPLLIPPRSFGSTEWSNRMQKGRVCRFRELNLNHLDRLCLQNRARLDCKLLEFPVSDPQTDRILGGRVLSPTEMQRFSLLALGHSMETRKSQVIQKEDLLAACDILQERQTFAPSDIQGDSILSAGERLLKSKNLSIKDLNTYERKLLSAVVSPGTVCLVRCGPPLLS
jgi:hypothetical protein